VTARTTEVLATYERLSMLPRSSDPLRAARAQGVRSWARAAAFDPAVAADLLAACGVLEAAGERALLPCFQTALGLLLTLSDLPRALMVLDGALTLARAAGQTGIEVWALMQICYAHLHAGALDEAQRRAEELVGIARARHDAETLAYAR